MKYGIDVVVNPGELDTPITIYEKSSVVLNDLNEETITYTSTDVMGKFEFRFYSNAKEVEEAGKETATQRARLLIRHFPGLDHYAYVSAHGLNWNIDTIGYWGGTEYNIIQLRRRD